MKLFYYDAYLDEGVESDELIEVDLNQAIDYFYKLTDEEGCFLGFIDDDENCIQFAWVSQDNWLVDIPNSETNISLQKYADYEACINIIERIFKTNEVEKSDDMLQVNILNESLEDVRDKNLSKQIFLSEKDTSIYKTFKGKNYTKEEWEAFEKEQWERYNKK